MSAPDTTAAGDVTARDGPAALALAVLAVLCVLALVTFTLWAACDPPAYVWVSGPRWCVGVAP